MTKYFLIPALIFSAAAAFPAAAAAARTSITADQVTAALNGAGMQVSAQQITMLTDVVATTSAPLLKVESMEPWGSHRMMVRMNCAQTEECLPFFVAVRFNQGDDVRPVSADSSPSANARVKPGSASFTVKSGAPATLMLDGERVHIKISVICLENGSTGQTIRVSSKDHRLTYTAEVVDGGLLKGRL
jgi:hypothetical protein